MFPVSVRLSLHYAALFAVVGVSLPYWPLWLQSRGLTPLEIGVVTGATVWGKMLINPLAGLAADGLGRPRLVLAVLALGSLCLFAGVSRVEGMAGVLAVSLAAAGLFAALMPLTETLTLGEARQSGLDYGRIRLWGSLSFILVSFAMGPVIDALGAALIPWTIVSFLGLILVGIWGLPRRPRPPAGPPGGLRILLAPRFLLFLLASGLIQAGHATYYTLATVHWRLAGLDGTLIGLLWAEGVVAEVVLFFLGARLVRRLGPLGLLGIGSLCGVVRWSVTATTTDPLLLALSQTLHAGTFACAHLGAMHYMAATIPPALSNRAQALYSTLCQGVLMGLAMTLSGWSYAHLGGGAFLMDALLCALGGILVFCLGARGR